MNEKDFSTQIEDLLAIGGWDRWIHMRPAPEQRDWLAAHKAVGNRVYVWYPKDYQDAQEVLLAGCDFDCSHVKENGRML